MPCAAPLSCTFTTSHRVFHVNVSICLSKRPNEELEGNPLKRSLHHLCRFLPRRKVASRARRTSTKKSEMGWRGVEGRLEALCVLMQKSRPLVRKHQFNVANETRQLPLLEAVQTCSETAREGGREGGRARLTVCACVRAFHLRNAMQVREMMERLKVWCTNYCRCAHDKYGGHRFMLLENGNYFFPKK